MRGAVQCSAVQFWLRTVQKLSIISSPSCSVSCASEITHKTRIEIVKRAYERGASHRCAVHTYPAIHLFHLHAVNWESRSISHNL